VAPGGRLISIPLGRTSMTESTIEATHTFDMPTYDTAGGNTWIL